MNNKNNTLQLCYQWTQPKLVKMAVLISVIFSSSQRNFILPWLQSVKKDYLLDKPSPWITFGAIEFLSNKLRSRNGLHIFEYGSGGSTLFWLTFDATCVSVEHDAAWYKLIREKTNANLALDYRLVLPQPGTVYGNNADPHLYLSGNTNFQGFSFYNYVSQIDSFPDNYFDVILIDGRARPSCLVHSIPKLKPLGTLVLDNADRSRYLEQTQVYLKGFKKYEFFGLVPKLKYVSRTDIYIKF